MNINWIAKGKKNRICDKDVRLATYSNSKQVKVTFFHGCEKPFNTTNYVQIGICGNRVYFRENDETKGHKMVFSAQSACTLCTSKELYEFAKTHKAEYNLEYDVENNLYYIEDNESNV